MTLIVPCWLVVVLIRALSVIEQSVFLEQEAKLIIDKERSDKETIPLIKYFFILNYPSYN